MSEKLLIQHCAPTLAGLKTGSLFSCSFNDPAELTRALRDLNRRLSSKGLRVLPLRRRGGRALIYVYRPAYLRRDLGQSQARAILGDRGYPEQPDSCLAHLIRNLAESEDFPHEIGLFLGYPPEDVHGFIRDRGECEAPACKLVGTWKVYGDEQSAQKRFELYRKCTRVYHRHFAGGTPLERLTVAASLPS